MPFQLQQRHLLKLTLRPTTPIPLHFLSKPPPPLLTLKLPSKTLLKPLKFTCVPIRLRHCHHQPNDNPFAPFLQSLSIIKPFILSQHRPILLGWLCSLVSVASLSLLVPRIANFSSSVAEIDAAKLRVDGLAIAALFLARSVATYFQQAFLWDAALSAVYQIRVHVFERVLGRELGFFEGGTAVSGGDVAYRITAEAADVADTIYALLNTIVPSALQLSMMATRMLVITPELSLIAAMAAEDI